ncbi:MAG: hydroxyethylthiazole kinase [Alphaproteobacteria bacterium]
MGVDAARTWSCLQAIRRGTPLIQNITNFVSMDMVANGLLALGASPAMVHAVEEVSEFGAIADALVVNIGTLSSTWVPSMLKAAGRMAEIEKPWVLDPVGVGATAYRTGVARDLLAIGPSVLRANASEVLALAGGAVAPTKGVDSTHGSEQAIEAARALARQSGSIVAVTGAVDYVTDGERALHVGNGHPLMTRVTALGCTSSAVVAAFLTVEPDPLAAAAEALAVFGLAAQHAARKAEGPGSLRWRLLDALAGLDETMLQEGVDIR